MTKLLPLLILLSFTCVCARAQVNEYGERNGYDWNKFRADAELRFSRVEWANKQEWIENETYNRKVNYLLGIYDLETRMPSNNYMKYKNDKGKEQYVDFGHPYPYLAGTSPDQMLKALDNFYKDYRNMNIKILDAIHVCQMEIKGAGTEDIDWQTRYYRADEDGKQKLINEKYSKKK